VAVPPLLAFLYQKMKQGFQNAPGVLKAPWRLRFARPESATCRALLPACDIDRARSGALGPIACRHIRRDAPLGV
jgi:hypothetical protein